MISSSPPLAVPAAARPAESVADARTVVVGGSLQRDLFRLGVVPCAAVALALTAWFTHSRLDTLEVAFNAEGQAVARQVAAMSDLSLYAGDLPALQNVANAALRGGQVTRVEISNSAGIYVTAGSKAAPMGQLRMFTAPVTLREASKASAFAPEGATAAGEKPIGLVQAFRDTTAYAHERTRSLMAGIGIAMIALIAAWAWVRHTARSVAQPLRRISRTVAALEAGQFDARCNVVARDGTAAQAEGKKRTRRTQHELAGLAHDINRLAERLQRNRQESEQQVREATAVALQRMAEAEQAALSRARFLAAASHDLRQPLHAMGLFIDGLLPTASEAQRPAVLRLQEGAEFMGVLLDDLLEISRLDAQVLTPAIGNVSLAMLFDQLGAQHAARAAASQVRLVWQDRGLAVRSDPALLLRILGNLVGNAITHSGIEGTVLVAARRRGGRVRIEVRDNGIGIAPIHQARIFEEFYQVANTERDRRQGFGLGLAICARIAALLGTRIGLRSALQAGSTFSLELPAADPRDVPPPAPEPVASSPLAGLRCLVVDDDPAILDATRALLTQWDCEVACVASGSEAMRRLAEPGTRFDVLLCDLQLADAEDGMEVIDAARRLQPHALAVLVSGATGPEVLQRLRQGGVTLLTKPVAPAKLRALLSTRRAGRAAS
ncbi:MULTISPECIES: hybrid sensor histidine kinase/response regulator [unclassified Variovorax]|uniref:ATP-binding response regulator n=1 Tax=unclassified Variovorax TaxID=663243 RepID=UPI00076CCCFD|nr:MULTISPECIES: hybrid sensor histidine kinase/response regulator [unclassified Variovorax]KWT96678.1 Sensory box histidine kinase/response regulator [Variovorax sp. WDL1]PNG51934.1 Sensor protein TorS [Variovorax sp. B2]PNG54281.1 Sensor protein TorS [Variovorax sp. B4]VTV11769.1 Sensor protein TorS [Variovorax sp. WDL1]